MTVACSDRERIFLDGTSEEWAGLKIHAESCASCAEELRSWENLSIAAADLQQQWDSPALWPRIEKSLARNLAPKPSGFRRFWNRSSFLPLPWQTAMAALLLLALTTSAVWFLASPGPRPIPRNQALLDDDAISEVVRAEAAYERAIDRLDAKARPQLENASTPLTASYREKLLVLDSAISDLKSQAGINPANGHLRRQLLAMYQEKQDTLEQVLEAKQ